MNGPHTTNPLAESQPEADSQPPDLADQRCVARDYRHAGSLPRDRARRLFTNKAVTSAFIDKAEMRCKTTAGLVLNWLRASWAKAYLPRSGHTV